MLRILTLIIIIFYSFPSFSEIVTGEGEYRHLGNISPDVGCMRAKEKAKLDAIQKVSRHTISSDEFEKCTEIDGISNCHRNHFFLSSFNGDIAGLKVIDESKSTEKLSNGETAYICGTC